ncbi:MAG: hypothetical protein AAF585_02795, partial [Verrucomicrobiota bacterium]
FVQIHDFYHGKYRENLIDMVHQVGPAFLPPPDLKKLASITEEDKKTAVLVESAEPRLHPLWYFVVSLSRCLQEGENSFTPSDAYWLGLVDEVIGSDLNNMRKLVETVAANEKAASKKNASSVKKGASKKKAGSRKAASKKKSASKKAR